MPSNHLILCHPLLLPSIFPSIRIFFNESALLITWPKYWSFSFSISPSDEYPRLISFRIDWFDLLAVQGTLKSLLQHHNSKALVLQLLAWNVCILVNNKTHTYPYLIQNESSGLKISLTRWKGGSIKTIEVQDCCPDGWWTSDWTLLFLAGMITWTQVISPFFPWLLMHEGSYCQGSYCVKNPSLWQWVSGRVKCPW